MWILQRYVAGFQQGFLHLVFVFSSVGIGYFAAHDPGKLNKLVIVAFPQHAAIIKDDA